MMKWYNILGMLMFSIPAFTLIILSLIQEFKNSPRNFYYLISIIFLVFSGLVLAGL